ncbi:lysophospholipase [Sphingomonas sp. G-3-2-10]|uniref:alpha/beta hydrolase family protein n=1 Tax=Sphingomonas sp. G-3-2-10 TaxID=2728838 RepID=UPI001F10E434|nr:lysophospholipase [Sphingomonas sp. G-3-2-10]
MRSSLILLPLLLAGCATTPAPQQAVPDVAKLHVERFGDTKPAAVRTLIVILHGDGSPSIRTDEYAFAAAAVRAIPQSVAIAVLRPGYEDSRGKRSVGDRGSDTGDNYTGDRLGLVGDAILALKRRYPAARILVVGDEGGAAIAANLAGLRPGIFDGMVLVGCPCTLPEWRTHMARTTSNPAWSAPVTSLDPLKTAGGIRPGLRAAILVGADDKITPARFSRSYAEALSLRGIATDYRIVPGKGHDLLGDPEVLAATTRLAASIPGTR